MKLQVNTLMCKNHMHFAIPCLKSFMAKAVDSITLHIFDDGSLTEPDFLALSNNFEDFVIHKFHEYYDGVSESLRKYPTCLKYRKESPYALKLLDLPLSSPDIFVNLDSDIYFIKKFIGLNIARIEDPDYVGARDLITHCYDLTLKERYLNKKIPLLPDQLNSGFVFMNKRIYDLDFVEWFLKNIFEVRKSNYPRVTEQCVFAGLAAKKNSFVWHPKQIKIQNPYNEPQVDDSVIAIHFYHRVRPKLIKFIEEGNSKMPETNEDVVQLLLEPVTYHSLVRSAFERVVEKYVFHL
jgi:hypothetical protein